MGMCSLALIPRRIIGRGSGTSRSAYLFPARRQAPAVGRPSTQPLLSWKEHHLRCISTTPITLDNNTKKYKSINILYGSQTGTSQLFALQLAADLSESLEDVSADDVSVSTLDEAGAGNPSEALTSEDGSANIIISSVSGKGEAPENARNFYEWVRSDDSCLGGENDGGKAAVARYAVFGCGNLASYPDTYNIIGKQIDKCLEKKGGRRILELGLGDDGEDLEEDFDNWSAELIETLQVGIQDEPAPDLEGTSSSDDSGVANVVEEVGIDSTKETAALAVEGNTTGETINKSNTQNHSGGPHCPTNLPTQTIQDIHTIWSKIQTSTESTSAVPYGRHFYEKLMSMDADSATLFGEARLSILSRDFDTALSDYIASLSPVPGGPIVAKRDDFVGRMVRYGVSARTLWLAGDAFRSAAIAVSPRLASTADGHHGLDPWVELYYRVLVPPLHPKILQSMDYADPKFFRGGDLPEKLNRALLRSGRFNAAEIVSQKCPEALDLLADCASCLHDWKEGSSEWDAFEKACNTLHDGLAPHTSAYNDDPLDAICTLLAVTIPEAFAISIADKLVAKKIEDTCLVVAAHVAGPQRVIDALRTKQLGLARDSWEQVYANAPDIFGAAFYDNFTKNPRIAAVFQRTEFAMQRKLFAHQFHSIMIRMNERSLLPLIHELGARHRLHFRVGLSELQAISQPIVETMQQMHGIVHWNKDLLDAWGYTTDLLLSNMLVGWTCGMEMLANGLPEDRAGLMNDTPESELGDFTTIDMGKLRRIRDNSPSEFASFFKAFADKSIGLLQSSERVSSIDMIAERYQTAVELFIDEDDLFQMRDRLRGMGRRHKQSHGVKLEHLKDSSALWMSCGEKSFGSSFTYDVALEWARLWTIIASSFDGKYENECPSSVDLALPYKKVDQRPIRKRSNRTELELREKLDLPGSIALLTFHCSPPLAYEAGQYAKIKWKLPDGTVKSRFYSIASSPAMEGDSEWMQLCIKEVPNGVVSPFVVGSEFVPPATAELMMTAGHFTLPSPLKDMSRLTVSGGIGIVAFIGVIRSLAELCRTGQLDSKASLTLLHTERTIDFPFKDELFALADEFGKDQGKDFDFALALCITGGNKEEVAKYAEKYPRVSWNTERPNRDILQSTLGELSARSVAPSPDTFVCGPGPFQKAIRETLIDGLGMSKKAVHQEFFDL